MEKEILNYSFYGFSGNLGSFLALNISNYMIGRKAFFRRKRNLQHGFFGGTTHQHSFDGIDNISAPIISKHFADDTIKELDVYYKKTSLSLFFLGLVLFSCIAVGYPYLTDFMPKSGKLLLEAATVGLGDWFWHCCLNWQQVLIVTLFPCQNITRFNIYVMLFLGGSYHESQFLFHQ